MLKRQAQAKAELVRKLHEYSSILIIMIDEHMSARLYLIPERRDELRPGKLARLLRIHVVGERPRQALACEDEKLEDLVSVLCIAVA